MNLHTEMTVEDIQKIMDEAAYAAIERTDSEDYSNVYAVLDATVHNYEFNSYDEVQTDYDFIVVCFAQDVLSRLYCANVVNLTDDLRDAVSRSLEQQGIDLMH